MYRAAAAILAWLVLAPAASAATAKFDITYRLTMPDGRSVATIEAQGIGNSSTKLASYDLTANGKTVHALSDARDGLKVYTSTTGLPKGKQWLLDRGIDALPFGDPTVALDIATDAPPTYQLPLALARRLDPNLWSAFPTVSIARDPDGSVTRLTFEDETVTGLHFRYDEIVSDFGTPASITLPKTKTVYDESVDVGISALHEAERYVALWRHGHPAGGYRGVTIKALDRRYAAHLDKRIIFQSLTKTSACMEVIADGRFVHVVLKEGHAGRILRFTCSGQPPLSNVVGP